MAGRVRDDELTLWRREVAVRDIDGDALLALGAKAVGEEREVDVILAPLLARRFDGGVLIFENRLRIVEQASDQRAFAVVDASCGGEAQQLHVEVPGGAEFFVLNLYGRVCHMSFRMRSRAARRFLEALRAVWQHYSASITGLYACRRASANNRCHRSA
jgi:hypothetical protein